jgi:Zn-dependent peptidase ImmA (M78 family)
MKYTKYLGAKAFDKKPKSERQADLFALRLLCPACVIWGLGLDSPDEISRVCLVDADIASQRYERIEALYKRNRFLTSPLEAQVYALFDDFIKQTKAKEAYETETN